VTFGIYHLFWWYYINREMRDYGIVKGRDLGQSPTTSLIAIWFGAFTLYIATVWTIVTTCQRIHRSQQVAGFDTFNGWIAGLLWFFTLGLGGMVYMQYELNSVWRAPGQTGALLPGSFAAGPLVQPGTNADLDRLKQLTELRDQGSLSEEEFQAEKKRLGFSGSNETEGAVS
jgi:hypothetical protein